MTSFTGNKGFVNKDSAVYFTRELNQRLKRIGDLEREIKKEKNSCGVILVALKKKFQRGYYLPWIKYNVEASVSTCNKYVRLSRKKK